MKHGIQLKFECKKCDEKFTTKYDSRMHDFTVHEKIKPWICEECPAVYKSQHLLYQHKRNVHSKMKFECNRCAKIFNQKINLDTHISQVHEKKLAFCCTKCGKSFHSRANKSHHEKRCGGEKPFKCSICNKGLSTNSSLILHRASKKCNALIKQE